MAQENEVPLAPEFVNLLGKLKEDRQKLVRDKEFAKPEQLKAFLAQFLYPRLQDIVKLMGQGLFDIYSLAVSTEEQVLSMRQVYGGALAKLGTPVEGPNGELVVPGAEALEALEEDFFALGSLLQKKYPDDEELQAAFNRCSESIEDLAEDLMGTRDDDEKPADGDAEPEAASGEAAADSSEVSENVDDV